METRANYVLIGLFTLAVIAAGFGFVYWFHRGGGVGERVAYRVVFEGAVSGVRVGAPVLFNGIQVGEVSDLALNANDPRQVIATIAVVKAAPVRADTKVGIAYQGLTGIASLALRGGDQTAPALQTADGKPPVLQAEVGTTQDLLQSGREVLHRLDEMLIENQTALRNAIRNLEAFTGVMARNAERVDRIVTGVEDAVQGAGALINGRDGRPGEIQQTVQSFRQLGDNLDRRGGEAIQSFKDLAESLDRRSGEAMQSVKQSVENLEKRATETMGSVKQLADNLDKRTAEIAVGVTRFSNQGLVQWERLAVDGRRAANEFERAIRNFERNPSRLIWGGSLRDNGATGSTGSTPRRRAQ